MSRPTLDAVLMQIAYAWATRGTCARRKVGAVLADSRGVVVSHGYNGALSGMPHHTDARVDEPCDRCEHAERNALYHAARRGVSTLGTIAYLTDAPCLACARGLVQAGVARVIYDRPYRITDGLDLLTDVGIFVERWAN